MKMAHFILCSGLPTTKERAQLWITHVVPFHGLLEEALSDKGSYFTSWFASTQDTFSPVVRISPPHPMARQRVNEILEQCICWYSNYHYNNWSSFLHLAGFAYNINHASTSQSYNTHTHIQIMVSILDSMLSCPQHLQTLPCITLQMSCPANGCNTLIRYGRI